MRYSNGEAQYARAEGEEGVLPGLGDHENAGEEEISDKKSPNQVKDRSAVVDDPLEKQPGRQQLDVKLVLI